MAAMTQDELHAFLAEPLMCVLSVARRDKGPVAVPLAFLYAADRFWLVTSPDSLHGRLMQQENRATLTVHDEEYGTTTAVERYVIAEGPVEFTADAVEPLVLRTLAKDRPASDAAAWLERFRPTLDGQRTAALTPDRISGYVFRDQLG